MLRYEIAPAPQLQPDVKFIWALEEEAETYNRDSIIPDSYVELVINCGAPLYVETDDGERLDLPRVFLNGLQRKPLRLRTSGLCQFVAMKMYPWAVNPLIDVQANHSAGSITPLDQTWQDFGKTIATTVQHSGYEEAMYKLQQYVCDSSNQPPHDLHAIRTATKQLYASSGQGRMDELAAQTALSASQFERRFKYLTGVTPKTMARLIRFQNIVYTMYLDPLRRASHFAYDFGYTDQAHFIHDFKAFAALTPGEFLATNSDQFTEWTKWRQQKNTKLLLSKGFESIS
ncbi:MAG: AraC family transcriptional regulator [Anaerolineae bacterium]|nr:AraC family transcriptional regulator [Anaerolineae bacterium]